MDLEDLIPAILLYTKGREKVDGATRFQKLVFLAQEESDIPDFYAFEAGKYGPFSRELASHLEELRARGILEMNPRTNEIGDEKYVYSLTTEGIRAVQELVQSPDVRSIFDSIQKTKSEYNDRRLPHLLQYVYNKYPEYTTETELDLDSLFDPDARSEFVRSQHLTRDRPEVHEFEFDGYLEDPVTFENPDGSWTARDEFVEMTATGHSRKDALENLGLVIAAAEGDAGHEPTDDEIEELGVDPKTARDDEDPEIPEYMK